MNLGRSPVIAVGAVVVHEGRLLMVKRGNAPARGLWSLPGGHLEWGESLAEALRREVLEETGLDIEVGDLLGILELRGEEHFVILDFSARLLGTPELTSGGDADACEWVPLPELERRECTPRLVETLRDWRVL